MVSRGQLFKGFYDVMPEVVCLQAASGASELCSHSYRY